MTGPRVFVYVQHLLGIGHLKRAATLARELSDRGSEVTFATGGFPVPEIQPPRVHLVQLPPAGASGLDFRSLVDAQGRQVDEAWRERRRAQLLDAWRAARPHALVTELFPFGRRQMRFELLPLLEEASNASQRPIIVSSVRDVLGQRDPAKQDEMLLLFERHFDHLLVHGDPRFLPCASTSERKSRPDAPAGGNCTRCTRDGWISGTGNPPVAKVTSLPRSLNSRASVAARFRWPIPSRCWT